MAKKYEAPTFEKDGFFCPHCGVYAHQIWLNARRGGGRYSWADVEDLSFSLCAKCGRYALWVEKKMVYPEASTAPLPSEDMPHDIREDFQEARNIVNLSPCGATALLRLAIQKLMTHLGEKGKDLDQDIPGSPKLLSPPETVLGGPPGA